MFRFTIRDVLWLTVVIAVVVTLYLKQRSFETLQNEAKQLKQESKTWESRAHALRHDLMTGSNKNTDVEFIPNGIRYTPKKHN